MREFTLTLFLFMQTSGCAHLPFAKNDDLVLNRVPSLDTAKSLTAEQIDQDLSRIKFTLEHAYIGKAFLPDHQYADLLTELNAIHGPFIANDFCLKVQSKFSRVSDRHLRLHFNGVDCDNSRTESMGVGENYLTGAGSVWDVTMFSHRRRNLLQIGIKKFPEPSAPVWNGFLDKVQEYYGKADAVIVDLRGNSGGDDAMGRQLAKILLGREPVSARSKSEHSVKSEAALQIQLNRYEFEILNLEGQQKEVPAYLDALRAEYQNRLRLAKEGVYSETEVNPGDKKLNYPLKVRPTPIYLLMDRDTISSGESTLDYFPHIARIKRVGENTGGYIHFGNVGMVLLENSGAILQVATKYATYPDGRFLEKVGIAPDLHTAQGKDAMEDALKHYFQNY